VALVESELVESPEHAPSDNARLIGAVSNKARVCFVRVFTVFSSR